MDANNNENTSDAASTLVVTVSGHTEIGKHKPSAMSVIQREQD